MEWYRDDLAEAKSRDPYPKMKQLIRENGFEDKDILKIEGFIGKPEFAKTQREKPKARQRDTKNKGKPKRLRQKRAV